MTRAHLVPPIKHTKGLSSRITWLRDYFFKGVNRPWNNEFTSWTTGTPWDTQYNEIYYYNVPETYPFLQTFGASFQQAARQVRLPRGFWKQSLPERRAWFVREVMINYLPQEILPGDLIVGGRFNIQTSMCLTRREAQQRNKLVLGPNGSRAKVKWFHDHGYGNTGSTGGHLIPDHERVLREGWKSVYTDLAAKYYNLTEKERKSEQGSQLKAMMTSATLPRDLAKKYTKILRTQIVEEADGSRKNELSGMLKNLERVPWEPAKNFWEAVQALWINHMLIMSDENYPGPGMSFGRLDQILYPYWVRSIQDGMDREFGKEILKCFWVHANTAYDALLRMGGNQGISAGFGQLITLSGLGRPQSGSKAGVNTTPEGWVDLTNELTYVILEVVDEMSPILEPKPNVRLHENSPDRLLDILIEMISESQGAPFLLNFDERSMAGLLCQAKKAKVEHLINKQNVCDYAPVGCLENTMVGNDRSGTVDNNLNLLKAVELAMTDGRDLLPFTDLITGKTEPVRQDGPRTGDATAFATFDDFYRAFTTQMSYIVARCAKLFDLSDSIRARFSPNPYLSCLVKGCADTGTDITKGGAELDFTTLEGVTFATTIDSLLAVDYLIFEQKFCTMKELITALKANWKGFEMLQARARYKAPKYGRDDDKADKMALRVMETWTDEVWKHITPSTNRQFRPGMLSWNYWVGDGFILPASPDGRPNGQFLSNAICPSNGADTKGPTANTNSVGKALGGRTVDNQGDYGAYINHLPNGASHTLTFNRSMLRDSLHKEKFKQFLRGYTKNGGTALQINLLDSKMLQEAQNKPEEYRHLLVRVTGYNAYFTSIGRELQDELIARVNHETL